MAGDRTLGLARLEGLFGAAAVPQRLDHELDRALQRGIIVVIICTFWASDYLLGKLTWRDPKAILAVIGYGYAGSAFAYRLFLKQNPAGGISAQYVYLVLDPFFLILAMAADAERLAALNPFLLIVIVRCGIRYGTRTMWLEWGVTCIVSAIVLPLSGYWRRELELSVSYALLLLLIPVFFTTLIERVHKIRLIEEERARLTAMREAVDARSTFLAKISHELRSPLQSIVSALDVFEMRHGHGTTDDDALIGRMRRSSMLLNTQLRDLLTLARGQAGRLDLNPEPLEATALVEEVCASARESASEKGLALRLEVPSSAIFVVADGARIDQVLTNLVANSIRYTESGSVVFTLHPYDARVRCLRFTIADSGSGISAERLRNLFDPGQLLLSTDRKGEGSGIGLSVVRTLLDRMGGRAVVRSDVGRGTIVDVDIPAELVEADDGSTSTI
jgi:signal transduction histidine kinase